MILCRATWLLFFACVGLAGHVRVGAAADGLSGAADRARALKEQLLADPSIPEEIIFSARGASTDGHWYANVGWACGEPGRKYYTAGGLLCRLNLRTGDVTTLLEDGEGCIRDPQVHYDGNRILFAWRRGGSEYFNLYELLLGSKGAGGAWGQRVRQLTDGPFDDIEPAYLPDGSIIFCSCRCNCWVPCGHYKVLTLHRCDGTGGNIRRLSSNALVENTPCPLPDGRVLYTRWEYVDRNQMLYQHLWTINPDGAGSMVYYGNQFPGGVYIDARPVPGTDSIIFVDSPGHGRADHKGQLMLVAAKRGPDERSAARRLDLGRDSGKVLQADCREPYPLSSNRFFFAAGRSIFLTDGAGRTAEIYALPGQVPEDVIIQAPRPLASHPREKVLPSRVDLAVSTGVLVLANVYEGRGMEGVKRGEIRKLLVLEQLPKPLNMLFGQPPISVGGAFTLKRVLGTVPVEEDGSACLEVPAMRSLFFVALDENNMSVKRMQSFVTVQPGERTSCVGCHESRTRAVSSLAAPVLAATKRQPSLIAPIDGIPDVIDFPRDIQPVLDRYCVRCHNPETYSGRTVLTGDYVEYVSMSYFMLLMNGQVADGCNEHGGLPPRAIGSSASPLMKKIDGSHHEVRLSSHEYRKLQLWLDLGATYAGTYAALRRPADFPVVDRSAVRVTTGRRCIGCHSGGFERKSRGRDRNVRFCVTPGADAWVFNVSRPEKSLLVMAPLARSAGGLGLCRDRSAAGVAAAVFRDVTDPDCQALLAVVRAAGRKLDAVPRKLHNMQGFLPAPEYFGELKRFGILPVTFEPGRDAWDCFALDQLYWKSLWHIAQPQR